MDDQKLSELVQQKLRDLMIDHDFKLIHAEALGSFGNWVVVLRHKENCKLRIEIDRGELLIAFGPVISSLDREAGPWYDIKVVLRELGQELNDFPVHVMSAEMQWAAFLRMIQPLIPSICDMFAIGNYEKRKKNLEMIGNQIETDTWDKLIKE